MDKINENKGFNTVSLLIGFIIFIICIQAAGFSFLFHQSIMNRLESRALSAVSSSATNISEWAHSIVSSSESVAGNIAVVLEANIPNSETIIQEMMHRLVANNHSVTEAIFVSSFSVAEGGVYIDADFDAIPSEGAVDRLLEDDEFREVIRTRKSLIGEPYPDYYTQAMVISILSPVINNNTGQVIGTLAIDVDFDGINKMLEATTGVAISKTAFKVLLDHDGVIVADAVNENTGANYTSGDLFIKTYANPAMTPALNKQILSPEPTLIKIGQDYVVSAAVDNTPWSVVIYGRIDDFLIEMWTVLVQSLLMAAFAVILAIFAINHVIKKPFNALTHSLSLVQVGDFTKSILISNATRDITNIAYNLDQFVANLSSILEKVKNESEKIDINDSLISKFMKEIGLTIHKAQQNVEKIIETINVQNQLKIATSEMIHAKSLKIDHINELTDEQAKGLAASSVAVEQMAANMRSIDDNMIQASKDADELAKAGDEGKKQLNHTDKLIRAILEKSKALNETNKVIEDIAERTNLLAMNAAIEAAHAGDAGRGFAVVAGEIRLLAQNSSSQLAVSSENLKEVSELISSIVKSSQLMDKSFAGIQTGIEKLNSQTSAVKEAVYEQSKGSENIVNALSGVKQSSQEVHEEVVVIKRATANVVANVKTLLDLDDEIMTLAKVILEDEMQSVIVVNDTIKVVSSSNLATKDMAHIVSQFKTRSGIKQKKR